MKDLTQADRDRFFEQANELPIYLRVKGRKHPAKIYGRLLAAPVIRAEWNGYPAISTEVSWSVVERLANRIIDTVSFD